MEFTILVVGGGCANCERLANHAKIALEEVQTELGISGAIEKVTDYDRFLDYGVMQTPGLVINNKLKSSGRIVSPKQIADWLREAAGK